MTDGNYETTTTTNAGKQHDIYDDYNLFKNSPFRQQLLPAWRPVPTVLSTVLILLMFGLIFLAIGIILILFGKKTHDIKIRYDDYCHDTKQLGRCTLYFYLDKEFKKKNIVYYGLDDMYQIHRVYGDSRNNEQLNGKDFTLKEMEKDGSCDYAVTNSEMGKKSSIGGRGNDLIGDELAVPCGIVAKTFFNDSYSELTFYKKLNKESCTKENATEEEKGPRSNIQKFDIDETNITWNKDREELFHNLKVDDYSYRQWINMTDEHFIVWMRPPISANFRKIWGRINEDLPQGCYSIDIENNYNVSSFEGKKYFIIAKVNQFGGNNKFMGIAYISCGGICILLIFVVIISAAIFNAKDKDD